MPSTVWDIVTLWPQGILPNTLQGAELARTTQEEPEVQSSSIHTIKSWDRNPGPPDPQRPCSFLRTALPAWQIAAVFPSSHADNTNNS